MFRIVLRSLAVLGLVLIGLNIFGFFATVRYREISNNDSWVHSAVTMTPEEFRSEENRKDSESVPEYVTRLTHAMHRTIVNVPLVLDPNAFRVPLTENYLLFFSSFLSPARYQQYDFCNTNKALERGIGLCSQQALTMSQILTAYGVKAESIGMQGHVVTTAQVDPAKDTWWILDTQYDVIMPYSLAQIQKKPTLIRSYYQKAGHDTSIIEMLVPIYGNDNVYFSPPTDLYVQNLCAHEANMYRWIWGIPVLLILPFCLLTLQTLFSKHRRRHEGTQK